MRMIRPRLSAPQRQIAEEQEEYATVTAALVVHPAWPAGPRGHNALVLAYKPTEEERLRLANGEAVYLCLLTFGGVMQPVMLDVGPEGFAQLFSVEVEQ